MCVKALSSYMDYGLDGCNGDGWLWGGRGLEDLTSSLLLRQRQRSLPRSVSIRNLSLHLLEVADASTLEMLS